LLRAQRGEGPMRIGSAAAALDFIAAPAWPRGQVRLGQPVRYRSRSHGPGEHRRRPMRRSPDRVLENPAHTYRASRANLRIELPGAAAIARLCRGGARPSSICADQALPGMRHPAEAGLGIGAAPESRRPRGHPQLDSPRRRGRIRDHDGLSRQRSRHGAVSRRLPAGHAVLREQMERLRGAAHPIEAASEASRKSALSFDFARFALGSRKVSAPNHPPERPPGHRRLVARHDLRMV
jgi:hypothetical protein